MRMFEDLVATYGREIFAYGLRLTGDRDAADDLFQETFLAAFRAWETSHDANRRAWLYAIATRKAQDRWRRGRREVRFGDLALVDAARDGVAISRADLVAALRALADGERAAFVLRRVQGLPYAEVARVLGCSEVAARKRVSAATRKVKEAMA